MIDHLTTAVPQAWGVPDSDRLTSRNELFRQLDFFILSCKVSELSRASIKGYAYFNTRFLQYCQRVGVNTPGELDANVFRGYLLEKKETCNATSIGSIYKHVSRFVNWMVDEDILEDNPFSKVHPPRKVHKIPQPLDGDQVALLLSQFDDSKFIGARNIAIILMLYGSGVRLRELAELNIADVDFDRGMIKVFGKGAKERMADVSKKTQRSILKYLLMRKDGLPYLWVNEAGGPLAPSSIQTMFRRLKTRIAMTSRCSPHIFRHSFATQMLKDGADSFDVQKLLGHSSPKMTQVYTGSLGGEFAISRTRHISPVEKMKWK